MSNFTTSTHVDPLKLLDIGGVKLYDASTLQWYHILIWTCLNIAALELLAQIAIGMKVFGFKHIPVRGKPLETLSAKDIAFIVFNKLTTPLLSYHLIQFMCYNTDHVKWNFEDLTLWNTLGSLVAFHVVYDFFYCLFHRALHLRSIYKYIHKHHHRQMAPVRGNVDAVNVHPFEFIVGEYLHLFVVMVIPCHVYTVLWFVVFGGLMASLNHTRYNISIPGLYDVKAHDVHHRLPETNYGQYIMLWDHAFSSFRPYTSKSA